jgi:voltage-gated potassium channel
MEKADAFKRRAYYYLAALVVLIIVIGTVFYHVVERFSWLNAYYFCVTTLSTVGYGDVAPKTTAGKLFTTFYIFVGIGVFGGFINITLRRQGQAMRQRRNNGQTTSVQGKD